MVVESRLRCLPTRQHRACRACRLPFQVLATQTDAPSRTATSDPVLYSSVCRCSRLHLVLSLLGAFNQSLPACLVSSFVITNSILFVFLSASTSTFGLTNTKLDFTFTSFSQSLPCPTTISSRSQDLVSSVSDSRRLLKHDNPLTRHADRSGEARVSAKQASLIDSYPLLYAISALLPMSDIRMIRIASIVLT